MDPPPSLSNLEGSVGSSSSAFTPTLSRTARQIVETVRPGSGTPLSGSFHLSPSCWSSSSTEPEQTIEIPEYLESQETLNYLELQPATSQKIWLIYSEAMSSGGLGPYGFFDVVRRHTLRAYEEDAVYEEDDWEGVMLRCGMKDQFISRIMDPCWKSCRLLGTAKDCVRLNLEDRWRFLSNLDLTIKNKDRYKGNHVVVIDERGQIETVPNANKRKASGGNPDRRSPKNQPPADPSDHKDSELRSRGLIEDLDSSTSSAPASQPPPDDIPGYKRFYKGGELTRLRSIVGPNGRPRFSAGILSKAPDDFDQSRSGLYLTPQYGTAWQYAQWNSQVDGKDGPKIGILTIFIPATLLESKIALVGEPWRQFVWANRILETVPEEFDHLDEYDWIVGPICGQSGPVVAKACSSEELKTFRLPNGDSATQWFTYKLAMRRQLEEACDGMLWITETKPAGLRK